MKPTLGWWVEAAKQIGQRRAERAGVEFLGALALPHAAVVEQRFMARAPDYLEHQYLAIQVHEEANPRGPFDRAGERLEEWLQTMPVIACLEPMAVGL